MVDGVASADALIVDDQGLVRAGMRSLLEKAAPWCRVHEESSYQGAIQALTSAPFELVFLDIHLGGTDSGLDILRFVREQEMRCRAIMLSGDDDRDTVIECISLGASGYITKATGDGRVFEKAIQTVLNDGVYLPASMLQRAHPRPAEALGHGGTAASLGLSARQGEVLYYLCQGLSNKAIANRMGIEEGTVRKSYVSDLLRFFAVARRTELMIEVSRRQLRLAPPSPGGR